MELMRHSTAEMTLATYAQAVGDEKRAIPFTLDFEGLQNNEQILSFHDGGTGSLGSGPGTNYGVLFNLTVGRCH
jgi:hypothetical protein